MDSHLRAWVAGACALACVGFGAASSAQAGVSYKDLKSHIDIPEIAKLGGSNGGGLLQDTMPLPTFTNPRRSIAPELPGTAGQPSGAISNSLSVGYNASFFDAGLPTRASSQVVPSPSGVVLALAGAGIAGLRRRRR